MLIIKTKILFPFFLLFSLVISCRSAHEKIKLVDYVNPLIGVIDHDTSNCVVGPQLPFASVNPSPETPDGLHDGYSFYKPIRGFAQLHNSGTGWGKYGQILISPQVGLNILEDGHDSPKSNEIANAYYYSVKLDRYNISVEVTPTHNAAIYKFTFPKTDSAYITFDVAHNIPRDIATMIKGISHGGEVKIDIENGNTKVTGMGKYSGGFGDSDFIYNVYFAAIINKETKRFGVWKNEKVSDNILQISNEKKNGRVGAYLNFSTEKDETIFVKIAVSLGSIKKAEQYLQTEIPNWDFNFIRSTCADQWEKRLSVIQVRGGSSKEKKMFYTALYHSMVMPHKRTGDKLTWKTNEDFWDDQCAVWDTWHTMFPLMILINPQMVRENINSFINRYKYNGEVKDAYLAGDDMFIQQGGDNIDNIIADAFVKKLTGINWGKAYEILKHNAEKERKGWLGFTENSTYNADALLYKKLGWVPGGINSCSYTLEFAFNDFCISQMAKDLGKKNAYQKYLSRSSSWENLWNMEVESDGFTGFITPKDKNRSWIKIDPKKNPGSWQLYFYEGNSWTYSNFVPHNVYKLIELFGGKENFIKRLQYGFKNKLIDITNEPSAMTPLFFHYVGRPDLSVKVIKDYLLPTFTERGYPGNDDSGAMASQYIFLTMGIYPNAGHNYYLITSPQFEEVLLNLESGKKFIIKSKNMSKENIYVKAAQLNGKPIERAWIYHSEIINGGILELTLDDKPSNWGTLVLPPHNLN